ncbi:MAG: hypothetical protein VKP62_10370, partial [Candidatus Sericytochromatia bacterium]|nr:hypothetical protein [Candidatus Sericytochromatia bacterium]
MSRANLSLALLAATWLVGCAPQAGVSPAGTMPGLTPDQTAALARWTRRPVVLPWNEFLRERMSFYRHKVYPPRNARNYALLNTAMYDAMQAAARVDSQTALGKSAAFGILQATSRASAEAAAVKAACIIVSHVLPEEAAVAAKMAQDASDARVWAGLATVAQVTAGQGLGEAIARELLEQRRTDGAENYSPIPAEAALGVPSEKHGGLWNHPVATEPEVRLWRTWGLTKPEQFRLPEPPRPGSAVFDAELKEVMGIEATLTDAQKAAADRYALTAPPSDWNRLAVTCIEEQKVGEMAAARVLAHWARAQADAAIACWDSKYWWFQIRPQQEARRRDPKSTFWPYLVTTPSHPSYPSGHSTFSGAGAAVLSRAFPAQAARFEALRDEMSNSRIWGG